MDITTFLFNFIGAAITIIAVLIGYFHLSKKDILTNRITFV